MKGAEELKMSHNKGNGIFFCNLPETNPASLHLKIDGLEDDISFEGRQTVSFWEVILTLTGRHVRHTSSKNQSKQKNMKKPHSDDAFQRATKPVNLLPAQPSAGNMFLGFLFDATIVVKG